MKTFTMTRLTISLDEETEEIIEENVGNSEAYESKSEFVRNCIQAHTEVEQLETRVERLQNEKRMLLEQKDEHSQLVRYVESEQSYREASLPQRLKWWVFGRERGE